MPPSPDMGLWAFRGIVFFAVLVWGVGTLGRGPLTAWGLASLEATNPDGTAILPLRAAASLVLQIADPMSPLRFVPMVVLALLLFEGLVGYLGVTKLWDVTLRGSYLYYRIRTLSPVNRSNFPDQRPSEIWRALLTALKGHGGDRVVLTLSRTPNMPATLGVQVRGIGAFSKPSPTSAAASTKAPAPKRSPLKLQPKKQSTEPALAAVAGTNEAGAAATTSAPAVVRRTSAPSLRNGRRPAILPRLEIFRRDDRGAVRLVAPPDDGRVKLPTGDQSEVRRIIEGVVKRMDETAYMEPLPDPLRDTAKPGMILISQEMTLARSAHWPLRTDEDSVGGMLRTMARSLAVPTGVVAQEFQICVSPMEDSTSRRWYARGRWWAARFRRNDPMGLKPTEEMNAVTQKLGDVHVATTIRMVVLVRSAAPEDIAAGEESLGVMRAGLQGLEAVHKLPIVGVARQTLVPVSQLFAGSVSKHTITTTEPVLPERLQLLREVGTYTGWAALLIIPILYVAAYLGAWSPWQAYPWWAFWSVFAVVIAHGAVAFSSGYWLMKLVQPWVVLRRIARRRAQGDPLLTFSPMWRQPAALSSTEASYLWHLPTKDMEREIAWVSNRVIPTPETSFVPDDANTKWKERITEVPDDAPEEKKWRKFPQWITLGSAYDSGGRLRSVGMPLKALHQMMHITAGMGAGKSQAGAGMCWQLIPYGFMVLDGKGDDEGGGLAAVVRRYIPVEEEHRLFYLNVLETAFPIGLNPIYHMMVAMEGAKTKADRDIFFNEALGLILGLFERLDPGRWKDSPGMQQFALMGCHLVLRTGSSKPGEIPTMAKVARALEDEAYRKVLIEKYPFKNDTIYRFWTERQEELSDSQKSSLQALLRRLDLFLTNPITRPMLTVEMPSIDLRDAMDAGKIVLIPMPHRRLGGLAPLVGMLIMQSIVAAAYARKGDAQTRDTAPVFIDEVQVFIVDKQSPDLEQAFTQLRGFAVPLIVMHQTLDQLGDLEATIRINAANRLILRTGEPDASTYAKDYDQTGMVAEDIKGMEALHHQYAVTLGPNREQLVFSLRPNFWPAIPDQELPTYTGPENWQELTPPIEPSVPERLARRYAHFDTLLARANYKPLMPEDYAAMAEQFAMMPQAMWDGLLIRWEQVRQFQYEYILNNPAVIPDQIKRQTWLTNLVASRGAIIEEALTLRMELQMAVLAGKLKQAQAGASEPPVETPANLGSGSPAALSSLTDFQHTPDAAELKKRQGYERAGMPIIEQELAPKPRAGTPDDDQVVSADPADDPAENDDGAAGEGDESESDIPAGEGDGGAPSSGATSAAPDDDETSEA